VAATFGSTPGGQTPAFHFSSFQSAQQGQLNLWLLSSVIMKSDKERIVMRGLELQKM
jgi:hypothetical protein